MKNVKIWYLTNISKFKNKNKNVMSLSNRLKKGKYPYIMDIPKR